MLRCQRMMVGRTGGANEMREDRKEASGKDEASCAINSFVHDRGCLLLCMMDVPRCVPH